MAEDNLTLTDPSDGSVIQVQKIEDFNPNTAKCSGSACADVKMRPSGKHGYVKFQNRGGRYVKIEVWSAQIPPCGVKTTKYMSPGETLEFRLPYNHWGVCKFTAEYDE